MGNHRSKSRRPREQQVAGEKSYAEASRGMRLSGGVELGYRKLANQASGFRFNATDNRQLLKALKEKSHVTIAVSSSRKINNVNKMVLKVQFYINSTVVRILIKLYKWLLWCYK